MRTSFGLCLAALLLGSSSLFGQTTNADAEKALSKGQDAFEDDKSNAAIRHFNKAIELDPNYADAYNYRGEVYSYLEKYPEALADFSKAVTLNPKLGEAFQGRGTVYFKTSKFRTASSDYISCKKYICIIINWIKSIRRIYF